MLDPVSRTRIHTSCAAVRVIHLTMLSSLVIFWGVIQLARRLGGVWASRGAFSEVDWLRYSLYILTVGVVVGLLVLTRRTFTPRGIERRSGDPTLSSLLRVLSSAHIRIFALAEVPAVLGIGLYLVGGYLTDFYVLASVTLLSFLAIIPRPTQWEEIIAAIAEQRPEILRDPLTS